MSESVEDGGVISPDGSEVDRDGMWMMEDGQLRFKSSEGEVIVVGDSGVKVKDGEDSEEEKEVCPAQYCENWKSDCEKHD